MNLCTVLSAERTVSQEIFIMNRIKNKVINLVSSPYSIMVIILTVFLVYLIVIPLFGMIATTFQVGKNEVRSLGKPAGSFTLYYWIRLFASTVSKKMFYIPFLNSLTVAISASVIAIVLGCLFAWLMVRTNIPYKKFFSIALLVPYMIPSWSLSLSWLAIFKNQRIGGAKGFLAYLGFATPDWLAYGPLAIIIVLGIHYYAYAYLLVSASLQSINSELEEMGQIIGASKGKILRKVTFPLVMPAILSSVILTFTKCMGTFGVPAFLGTKVKYYTISTTLYSSMKTGQRSVGFAVACTLIVFASITVFINQKIIGQRKSYATIGGKGGRSTLIDLGKSRTLITALIILFLFLFVAFPIVVMAYETFLLRPGDFSFENLTLQHWVGTSDLRINSGEPGILQNPQFLKYVWNTLRLTLVTALIGTILGQIIGYIVARGRQHVSGRFVEQLVFMPYLIPSIAFGAMYLALFAKSRTVTLLGYEITLIPSLYGTFALLVLISIVKHLPFASRAGTANMLQISYDLEEAAHICGAGVFKRFTKILLPLSKGGFWSGFMLIFISIIKELDLLILLMTPAQQTLPYMAYSFSMESLDQLSNAVALVLFLIIFLTYWIASKFAKADISKGF